jgi:fucokinase
MAEASALHLRVALEANAAAYRRTVQTSTPGECWDILVLTAANEKQAEGYRRELELRHRAAGPAAALFPAIQRSIVVADPPGRRAGSGGATLAAVRAAAASGLDMEELQQRRILVIHSGGASQRLPAYSAQGKIFSPLPLLRPDGQISTLFDHLYVTLAGVPGRFGPGMLVVAGDVFLLFDHRYVSRPLPGVTALTLRVEPGLASGHGVYVVQGEHRIRRTLQKVPAETMREWGALDERGRVLIDTGLLFFDAQQVKLLGKLAGLRDGKPRRGLDQTFTGQIDLYSDITAALAADTERSAYLADGPPGVRRKLWSALHGTPFQAMVLEGEFLHLGTTRQFRDAMVGRDSSAAAALFQQDLLIQGSWPVAAQARPRDSAKGIPSRIYHSVLLPAPGAAARRATAIGAGSVIDHSILAASSRIGRGSVVSQVFSARRLCLGEGLLFFQVPIAAAARRPRRYAQVLCGVEDDFKGRYGDGSCTFLNQPIDKWLARHGLTPESIWSGVKRDARTLWNARLFPATARRDEAAAGLRLAACDDPPVRRAARRAAPQAPRYSMAMILEEVDPLALIEHREVVSAYLQAGTLLHGIRSGQPLTVDSAIGHFTLPAGYEAV